MTVGKSLIYPFVASLHSYCITLPCMHLFLYIPCNEEFSHTRERCSRRHDTVLEVLGEFVQSHLPPTFMMTVDLLSRSYSFPHHINVRPICARTLSGGLTKERSCEYSS